MIGKKLREKNSVELCGYFVPLCVTFFSVTQRTTEKSQRNTKRIFLILIFFLLIISSQALGQIKKITVADSTQYAYELEEIILYGDRDFVSPSMLNEISSEQIENKNAFTIADILKTDPALNLTSGPKAETEIKIRGFPAQDVLVLVDGRPINPGYYGKVDLSMLPVDNIAKLNVVKGPSSVAYGVNSMGGVVDIITKNGFEEPQTVFDLSLGNYQFRNLSLNHSHQLEKLNYWISAYENYSNGFKLSDNFEPTSLEDGGLRDNSFYHKIGGNLKLGYQTESMDLYSFSVGYNWAEKDVPTTIYSWDNPTYRKFPEWQRFSSALSGQWNISNLMQLKSVVYLDAYQDRLIDYKTKEMNDDEINFDSDLESWTAGASLESKFSLFDVHQVHSGASFKRDLMNKKSNTDQPWVTNLTYTGNLFLQDYFKLWENTNVTLGLSYLYFNVEEGQTKNKISPLISLSQNLFANFRIYASYANAVRVPTLFQLYSETSGNPNLKPEDANKIETGIEWYLFMNDEDRYLSLQLAWFYNDLKNLIYRASSSYRFQNISEATLYGAEVQSVFNYNRYLSAELGYAYLNSPGSSTEVLEEVPKNKIYFRLSIRTDLQINLNYELNYFDERTTYVPSKNLDSYILHSVNIGYQLLEFLKLRAELNNITDVYYEEELGYPSAGRTFIFGATLTF
jgi:iron complex outermembrane receptor protein/outer membrane receptor for ferrienterochelin and colicins